MNDPDGHIIEIATVGPGFAIDEPWDSLGERLQLPPWLEKSRNRLEFLSSGDQSAIVGSRAGKNCLDLSHAGACFSKLTWLLK